MFVFVPAGQSATFANSTASLANPLATETEAPDELDGFIAALDQSGGSTPKALKGYGVEEGAWSSDEEMFGLIHAMRSRIITAPCFNGDKVIGANLKGAYFLATEVARRMIVRQQGGNIVNIASVAGKEGNPNASAYSASKAGVIGLTKWLGKELATSGVLVNCVAPAVVKTELFSQMTEQHIQYMLSKIPMNRFGEVDEVAEMVAWLASPACTFSTAAVFDLSGGRATY